VPPYRGRGDALERKIIVPSFIKWRRKWGAPAAAQFFNGAAGFVKVNFCMIINKA